MRAALEEAEASLKYHDKRMGKRIARLNDDESFSDDEPPTGVRDIPQPVCLPDPFPPQRR